MGEAIVSSLRESELWLLSFYRQSEIAGALFFGRLAKNIRRGAIQRDMAKHFADESQHAWYWTRCVHELGADVQNLPFTYQDQYIEAGGMPVNMMEILAVTLAFERRVIGQYVAHSRAPGIAQPVVDTLAAIMTDEKWHIRWVTEALDGMKAEYGADVVEATLKRYIDADREVYRSFLDEYAERMSGVMQFKSK